MNCSPVSQHVETYKILNEKFIWLNPSNLIAFIQHWLNIGSTTYKKNLRVLWVGKVYLYIMWGVILYKYSIPSEKPLCGESTLFTKTQLMTSTSICGPRQLTDFNGVTKVNLSYTLQRATLFVISFFFPTIARKFTPVSAFCSCRELYQNRGLWQQYQVKKNTHHKLNILGISSQCNIDNGPSIYTQ